MPSLRQSLLAFVRQATRRIDYLALYPATVNSQNSDGTLELTPDDARIAGASKVPVNLGLPGVEVKVPANARVLLGFAGGDPQKPRATLWEVSELTEIKLTATGKVNVVCPAISLGDAGVTAAENAVALAGASNDGLSGLHNRIAALESIFRGAPVPEPGMGAPSALQLVGLGIIGPVPATAPTTVAATKVKAV